MSDNPSGSHSTSRHPALRDSDATGRPIVPGKIPPQTKRQKEIIALAKKRFKETLDWEAQWRDRFIDDVKFAEADSYNGYQWPNAIRKSRDVDERPCLTINKTRQACLRILNEMKEHKSGIRYRPTGNAATAEASNMLEGLARHIEYQSSAEDAYELAQRYQVQGGIGWVRVYADYCEGETFDQEIYIRPVKDPLSVMVDPHAQEADKSDARFMFVFENLSQELFEDIYPQYAWLKSTSALEAYDGDWITKDSVRICEYFWVEPRTRDLITYKDKKSGLPKMAFTDKLPKAFVETIVDDPSYRHRQLVDTCVMRAVIIADYIVEEAEVPGRYIPLSPFIGEETIIDGLMDRKGHVRALIDPQRMYNYYSSAAVEFGALQGKSPWIAPEAAIEGHETYWNTANKINHSVLTWNHVDDDGGQIPPPERPRPPEMAPAYLQGMQISNQEMAMVSGQYDSAGKAQEQAVERSARAIEEREYHGDQATFHYINNSGKAIRHVGRIILGMIPEIYDTQRVLKIMAEDGTSLELEIDPNQQKAHMIQVNHDGQVAKRVLNPTVGRYDVQADVGPAWGTKRRDTVNALSQIIERSPNMAAVIGDLLIGNMDFPLAQEAAERLRRMVPPQALGQGPTQMEQHMSQVIQKLQGIAQQATEKATTESIKLKGKAEMHEIDAYKAETERMKALADIMPQVDPQGVAQVVHQMVQESLATHLAPLLQGLGKEVKADAQPPTVNDSMLGQLMQGNSGANGSQRPS